MRLALRDLAHGFGDSPELFSGLTASFVAGDLVAVTGPSGSGKSTLLSLIAGGEQPRRETVTGTAGVLTTWVLQHPSGTPARSALDHVVLPLLARGQRRRAAEPTARAILVRFGLGAAADRPFRDLSGGEAQRLMLARAVARDPDLLLVDEPTAQLDLVSAATVNAVLGELAGARALVIVATHDEATRRACTRHLDLREYPGGR